MNQLLFLDSGRLGLITHPQRSSEVVAVTGWLTDCIRAGMRILVPAIVYYEIKRELLRARKDLSVARLDAFVNAVPGRYLPLTHEALRLAAELWAHSRQDGRATAVLIATTNVKHLSRFAPAKHWMEITPERS